MLPELQLISKLSLGSFGDKIGYHLGFLRQLHKIRPLFQIWGNLADFFAASLPPNTREESNDFGNFLAKWVA